jgi:hypothetical protein
LNDAQGQDFNKLQSPVWMVPGPCGSSLGITKN